MNIFIDMFMKTFLYFPKIKYIHVKQYCRFSDNSTKIIGLGFNYTNPLQPRPREPIVFLKPLTGFVEEGDDIIIPSGANVHEEVELGVVIGKKAKNIALKQAYDYVAGYCVALDLTDIKILAECRKKSLPWTRSKAFDYSCPISRMVPKRNIPNPHGLQLFVKVNDKFRYGRTSQLIFHVPQIITFLSQYMTLNPNDLILTGSFPGLIQIKPGDNICAGIANIITMKFHVTSE